MRWFSTKKRICMVHCHPGKASFNNALADAYEQAAKMAGHELTRFNLYDMQFDPILRLSDEGQPQPLEPDLIALRDCINWSNHLVLVFPLWWFSLPALFKGALDRVLAPGWAFMFRGPFIWDKLLKGRSARIIYTMDSPPAISGLLIGNPIEESLKRGTLSFVGFDPVELTAIGPVKLSNDLWRSCWLKDIKKLGKAGI